MSTFSRRDFLKLGTLAIGSLAFAPFPPFLNNFDDSDLVRVTTDSVPIRYKPSDESIITGTWYRDELVHVYEEVKGEKPEYNPIWYRVWGGYMHRGRLQKVKVIYNEPINSIPADIRRLAEVTVPYTQAMRHTKTYGWQPLYRLYYESVHWIDAVEEGPDGGVWYRIFDELVSVPYHVPASHLRLIPPEELTPITPEIAFEDKRIEVNLTTQVLTAYEYNQIVFQTNISSGISTVRRNPKQLSTKTPKGEFHIEEKMPSKHMGDGSLASDIDAYELPGVPWTCFFSEVGHAFHGTYWHDNFGTPMSHGCVNMRTVEAKWLFRWAQPPHQPDRLFNRGYGTLVEIHY